MKQILNSTITQQVKKSDFITYTYQFKDVNNLQNILNDVRKNHPQARHIVYAYVLNKDNFKYSDDREPKNTAGKPICNILIKNDIIYSLVIVVRYFGGIKLGANGLIRSYPLGLKTLIEQNQIIDYIEYNSYSTKISIQDYNKYLKLLPLYNHNVNFNNLEVEITFKLSIVDFDKLSKVFELTKKD